MWKWLAGGIGLIVVVVVGCGAYLSDKVYLRFGHAEVAEADLERRYAPELLKADFRHLTRTIEHIHPDIAAITDPVAYARSKVEIETMLDRPMTRAEFYRVVSRLNGQYRDGHTGLRRPAEEWEAAPAALLAAPFTVAIAGSKLTVARSLVPALPADAEIVSINGGAGSDLATWMLAATSGETTIFRQANAAKHFPDLAYAYGLRAPYAVTYRVGESAPNLVQLAGIDAGTVGKAADAPAKAPYSLVIDGETAILTIDDLKSSRRAYDAFLKEGFGRIGQAGVTDLILDLRANGGGDSRQGDKLLTYLSDRNLPALQEVAVRTTPEVKAVYRTLLPPEFRWLPIHDVVPMLRGIQAGHDDGFYRFDPDGAAPSDRRFKNKLSYKGRLYVLTGPTTYSSAAILAAPLKHWKRATVIGEPTGEPLAFYGDNYEFDLPNTRLVASASHKTFRLVGEGDPRAGIQPDVHAPSAQALDVARREIARRRQIG